jgi:hypothetical protein
LYCPTAAPALQFLLAGDRFVYVAKVLKPDEPVQMIAFRKPVNFSMPVLVQTPRDVIRDSDIQRGAVFIGEDVYPVLVIAHASRNNQRCFASLNMTKANLKNPAAISSGPQYTPSP